MQGLFVSMFLVYGSLLIGSLSGYKGCLISLILLITLPIINTIFFRYYRKNKLTLLSNLLKNNSLISEFISNHTEFEFRNNYINTKLVYININEDCYRWLDNEEKDDDCRQFLVNKINSEQLLPFKINQNLLRIALSNNKTNHQNLLEQKENDQNLNKLEIEFVTIKDKLIKL